MRVQDIPEKYQQEVKEEMVRWRNRILAEMKPEDPVELLQSLFTSDERCNEFYRNLMIMGFFAKEEEIPELEKAAESILKAVMGNRAVAVVLARKEGQHEA
jgi:hypothetical protein